MKTRRRGLYGLMIALGLIMLGAAMPGAACAAELGGTPIEKVLATTSSTPVAGQNALEISGATSTEGCYFNNISWYDAAGAFIDGAFTTDAATVYIRLDAAAGYFFQEGLSAYLNNSAVEYTIYDGGSYIVLARTYSPDVWVPTIIKHPGGETVEEGGWCSFVATASSAESSAWRLRDANGKEYSMEEMAAAFPGMTYTETLGKVVIRNIPAALNGSKIYCTFTGAGGAANTNTANLNVKAEAAATPSPSPTPTPSAAPSPSASPAAGTGTGTDKADAAHEHEYSRAWSYDDDAHWHECSVCGDRADEAGHTMTWTATREATKRSPGEEQGECGVCDYETTREVEYVKPAESGKWILYAGIGAVALVLALMAASTMRQRRAAKRRAAVRRRRYYDE